MLYKELIDLGFERDETLSNDPVFYNHHGFECFWLEKILHKNKKESVYIHWHPENGKMELITCHNDADITSRREIMEDELKVLVEVFDRSGSLPKEDHSFMYNAC